MSLEQNVRQGNSVMRDIGDALKPVASVRAGIRCHWCLLDRSCAELALVRTWLSDNERARMARFGKTLLQDRYAVGRGSLRLLLGRHLGLAPEAVPIIRGERGRPRLDGVSDLDFNVSHTQDAALFAIAANARVGIDIERASRAVNASGIARKFLGGEERSALEALADEQMRTQVLRLWTCKEAMSKATGDALSAPFAKMQVQITPTPRVVAGPVPYQPADWDLFALDTPSQFIATLAVWRAGQHLSRRDLGCID